jgi:hypothetical protein
LTCEYLREFSKKFETVLMDYSGAGGKLIHQKNQKQKISWHCPFKQCCGSGSIRSTCFWASWTRRPQIIPNLVHLKQCSGSGSASGSTGSSCFWAGSGSRFTIQKYGSGSLSESWSLYQQAKKVKKNLNSYCFVPLKNSKTRRDPS